MKSVYKLDTVVVWILNIHKSLIIKGLVANLWHCWNLWEMRLVEENWVTDGMLLERDLGTLDPYLSLVS